MEPRKKRKSTAFDRIDIHVGGRVKIRRKNLRMSQTTLGEAVGVSFQQAQKYERGANRISASRLFEISQVLDVPVSYFFDGMPGEIADRPDAEEPDLEILGSVRPVLGGGALNRAAQNLAKADIAVGMSLTGG